VRDERLCQFWSSIQCCTGSRKSPSITWWNSFWVAKGRAKGEHDSWGKYNREQIQLLNESLINLLKRKIKMQTKHGSISRISINFNKCQFVGQKTILLQIVENILPLDQNA
jgi:hypothetical protein